MSSAPAPANGSASAAGRSVGRISVDELRTLFLFENLDDAQLARIARHGEIREYDANDLVFAQGEPATEFFVLLEGTLALGQRVQDGELETVRTDYRGSYSGAVQAYLGERLAQVYFVSMRMVTDGRVFVLPAETFASSMREWFPMAMHLLEGMWLARQNIDTVVGQRERLLALGQLSAGLTHELNNPAGGGAGPPRPPRPPPPPTPRPPRRPGHRGPARTGQRHAAQAGHAGQ